MTWLRGPSRADRQAGLAEIGQLYREHQDLAQRPECNLALGVARSEMSETTAGLELIEAAAEGFAARGENERLAAALVELAETWSRHNEWESTPPRFGVSKPLSSLQAGQTRRQQIARVRERIATLPESADSLAQVDLIAAQELLRGGESVAAGLQMLEELAAAPQVTPPIATAIETLADRHEADRRWQDASKLYERLVREGDRATAEKARQKLAAFTRPQLRLEVPPSAPTGRPIQLSIAARNVSAIQVEVRKLDLQAWLTARQGRLNEALLPVAGSVQLSQRIDTPAPQPHDWWESANAGKPDFEAPPGAYVVSVQAADGGPRQRR